jgi:hypothetical protein
MKQPMDEQVDPSSGSFSRIELATWGFLDQAERERRRDQLIASVAMPPAAILDVLRAQWADSNGLSPQQWLEHSGLDASALDALVSRQWRWLRLCEERFSGSINSCYLARKAGLDQVRFWQLELSDGDLAAELYQRLRQREASFAALAQEFAADGAVMVCHRGPVPMDELSSDLRAALNHLKAGALLAPRLVGMVWQILQLECKEAQPLSGELRARLLGELGEAALAG